MKPIKCGNCKMFYDGDKYESCPHCKAAEAGEAPLPKPSHSFSEKRTETELHPITQSQRMQTEHPKTSKKISSLFGKNKRHSESESADSGNVIGQSRKHSGRSFKKDTSLIKAVSEGTEDFVYADDEELAQEKGITHSKHVSEAIAEQPVEHETAREEKNIIENKPLIEEPQEAAPNTAAPATANAAPMVATVDTPVSGSIAEAVKQADSTTNISDQKTVAYYNFSNSIEPVVGWIVCVKGEYKGESFNIQSGRNNIGRSQSMNIALAQEKSVSREKHAAITFEPHQKKFFIQAGESSGLTYVNDEFLMTFRELEDYDKITLGESEFIFLRLVSDKFSWEKYD